MPAENSQEKLETALVLIDSFCAEISKFLSIKKYVLDMQELEKRFDDLSICFESLMVELETLIFK